MTDRQREGFSLGIRHPHYRLSREKAGHQGACLRREMEASGPGLTHTAEHSWPWTPAWGLSALWSEGALAQQVRAAHGDISFKLFWEVKKKAINKHLLCVST